MGSPPLQRLQSSLKCPPHFWAALISAAIVVVLGANGECADPETNSDLPKKLTAEHLPNPVQVHPKVISGGLPAGDGAFAELKALGVQTIISVDGAKPAVAMAEKYGLRYVHLPHGYDGISAERIQELAKAVRDLPGPIYIHCHHGKHRSPAAACVACAAAGMIDPDAAPAVLKLAGTSEHYRGLYEAAASVKQLEQTLLDALRVDFRPTVELPPMAEAMVAIEHTHDHLKEIAAAKWNAPAAHPDLEPAHEALLLREHFTELLRAEYVQQEPDAFQQLLRDSESAARKLDAALRALPASKDKAALENLDRLHERINNNCTECHRKFRDIPLSDKKKD